MTFQCEQSIAVRVYPEKGDIACFLLRLKVDLLSFAYVCNSFRVVIYGKDE